MVNVLQMMEKTRQEVDKKFLSEWSQWHINFINRRLAEYFSSRPIRIFESGQIKHAVMFSFSRLNVRFGLAFESGNGYARYSICNCTVYYNKKQSYNHFMIGLDGDVYASIWDEDENEEIIKL